MIQLEHDPRMIAAWQSFNRHSPGQAAFPDVLGAILRLKAIVSRTKTHNALLSKAAADKERVIAAIAEIALFLHSIKEADGDSIFRLLRDLKERQAQADVFAGDARRMMKFAYNTLSTSEKRLNQIVNSSRKDAEHVSFSNLLCRLLCRKIERPLYSFVATTTQVLYELDDYTPEAVRMAHDRDLQRRRVSKNSTRTVQGRE